MAIRLRYDAKFNKVSFIHNYYFDIILQSFNPKLDLLLFDFRSVLLNSYYYFSYRLHTKVVTMPFSSQYTRLDRITTHRHPPLTTLSFLLSVSSHAILWKISLPIETQEAGWGWEHHWSKLWFPSLVRAAGFCVSSRSFPSPRSVFLFIPKVTPL